MTIQNINTAIKCICTNYMDTSYQKLGNMLDGSYMTLSFFGSRRVHAAGYSGSIPLKKLAIKVRELVFSNPHFNEKDREFGKGIYEKINTEFYRICYQQLEQANFITKIFVLIRNFFDPISIYIEDELPHFDYYTHRQFVDVFGNKPTEENAEYEGHNNLGRMLSFKMWQPKVNTMEMRQQ